MMTPFLVAAIADNATMPAAVNATLPAAVNATLPAAANSTLAVESTARASAEAAPVLFSWAGYFEAIGIMLMLLAMLWGILWLARRFGKFRFMPKPGSFPPQGLYIETQLPLGPRKGLYVVRFLNERLLLGVTDQQITLLKDTYVYNDFAESAEEHDRLSESAHKFARLLDEEAKAAPEPPFEPKRS